MRPPSYRSLLSWAMPLGTAVAALALAGLGDRLAPYGPIGPPGRFALLLLLAAAAAQHRPLAGSTLGVGTAVLPVAIYSLGAAPAAWLAGGALLTAEIVNRVVDRLGPRPLPDRRQLRRPLEAAATMSLAALAAGWVWARWAPGRRLEAADPGFLTALLAGAGAYLLLAAGLRTLEHFLHRPGERLRLSRLLSPLAVDLAAWGVGGALAVIASRLGFAFAAVPLAAVAALALEAFRNDRLQELSRERLSELREISRAEQRMTSEGGEIAAVAGAMYEEVKRVLTAAWFQLELADVDRGPALPGIGFAPEPARSWAAGPDGLLRPGEPSPGTHPPSRPGIHKRPEWKVLTHALTSGDRLLGYLRVWCDPRSLTAEEEAALASLTPQLASSLDRALLDRQARQDPLTRVAVRRVFESRLAGAHAESLDDGGSLAVILCDLDHFKGINDTHGHLAGDHALVAVARLLESEVRPGDLVCRYGGEEFIVLAPGVDGDTALALAEKVRRAVEAMDFQSEGRSIPLTLSAGVAAFPELYVRSIDELPALADAALYRAKGAGRNLCLLDLGRGRYQAPSGKILAAEALPEPAEPPRFFA